MTPPVACSLTKSAPRRSTPRTVLRTSSGPSQIVSIHSGPHRRQKRTPLGSRPSPCPPVCESAATAMRMRGPGISPRSIASLNPAGDPDASRTAVNPASRVVSAFCAASKVASVGGVSARCCMDFHEL